MSACQRFIRLIVEVGYPFHYPRLLSYRRREYAPLAP